MYILCQTSLCYLIYSSVTYYMIFVASLSPILCSHRAKTSFISLHDRAREVQEKLILTLPELLSSAGCSKPCMLHF